MVIMQVFMENPEWLEELRIRRCQLLAFIGWAG
jgi:hypothetical protein